MKSNKLNFDEFLFSIKSNYGEKIIFEAVQTLKDKDLLIEGQYPFLNDPTMRERNFGVQKKILRAYGYESTNHLILGAFEVFNEGWMHCFYILGNRFESPAVVRQEVRKYYEIKNLDGETVR